jgi:hypothetical protein
VLQGHVRRTFSLPAAMVVTCSVLVGCAAPRTQKPASTATPLAEPAAPLAPEAEQALRSPAPVGEPAPAANQPEPVTRSIEAVHDALRGELFRVGGANAGGRCVSMQIVWRNESEGTLRSPFGDCADRYGLRLRFERILELTGPTRLCEGKAGMASMCLEQYGVFEQTDDRFVLVNMIGRVPGQPDRQERVAWFKTLEACESSLRRSDPLALSCSCGKCSAPDAAASR